MKTRILIPFLLITMLILAACGAQETAEPAAEADSEMAMADTEMAEEEMADDDSDMEETMADDDAMMAEESESMAQDEDMATDHEEMDEDSQDMDEVMMDDDKAMEEDNMAEKDDSMADEASMDEDKMMADVAPWQQLALTNAASGEEFVLADFQGKTVFVEPMATWCGNCRKQQMAVSEAKSQLGDDVVFIGLSLETNLSPDELNSYAQGNGFDWTYAVMSQELLSQLTEQFGRSITSAPSTPHFLINPDGSFSDLSTGIHSAGEIVSEIQGVGG